MSLKLDLDFFSKTGKINTEKLNKPPNISKYKYGRDMFEPETNWEIKNYLYDKEKIEKECHLNIDELKKNIKKNCMIKKREEKIKIEENNKRNKKREKKGNIVLKKLFQGIKYKYHNEHISKMEKFKKEKLLKKYKEQNQTIYYPKYEYIYPKINTGIKWSNLTFKKNKLVIPLKNQSYNLSYHDPYYHKDNIKGFVDMSKQSNRKDIIEEKPFDKTLNFNFKISPNSRNNYPFLLVISKTNDEYFINNENNFLSQKRNEYNEYRDLKNNKSAPDFNRYLSREQLNNLFKKNDKLTNEELSPNYNSIESSTKMMVFYNKSRNHRLKDNRSLSPLRQKVKLNLNETFEKIYGNKLKVVPNFEKMTPRKEGALPSFLNGLTNRNIYLMRTDKSLKLNNYSDSKIYNLCGDMKQNLNKYKNNKILGMRNYYSFNNINIQNKKKVFIELKNQIKKFNRLFLNNENNNNNSVNYW